MRLVEVANSSLTVGAAILVPEVSATFDTNFMMPVLTARADDRPYSGSSPKTHFVNQRNFRSSKSRWWAGLRNPCASP